MSNFDDLFAAQGSQPYPDGQPFDKDAWAEKKKAERQTVFDLADSTAEAVSADGGCTVPVRYSSGHMAGAFAGPGSIRGPPGDHHRVSCGDERPFSYCAM